MKFILVGISDTSNYVPTNEVGDLISGNYYFSGGKRHYERVKHLLPLSHEWLNITIPLAEVLSSYQSLDGSVVVFVSGDPFFYGFGTTLKREFPYASFENYPYFNSLQMHAHRLNLPYEEMMCVSCTGRPWDRLNEALIRNEGIIGVLTDRKKRPEVIAQYLLDSGYDNYDISVGENLGGDSERLITLTLNDCIHQEFAPLNNIILHRKADRSFPIGVSNDQYRYLDGRPNMMTKPIYRLHTISLMQMHAKKVFWDVGFCTGSVSIEAKRLYPKLKVVAFEKRLVSEEIIKDNMKRFGAPGIEYVIGDFLNQDIDDYARPDAVFIGGHGGKLAEILDRIDSILPVGGIIATNAVKEESASIFIQTLLDKDYQIEEKSHIQLDTFNPVSVIVMMKQK
ncbi:precorrin-6y C5,15-methyltransferase (decarboxylating) subunit CbiE [Halosquirtibacter xylanolyticus]|uniref:precorrin-6y C5,15-methyltransferase (decarboxylating) subunit CbiE n=1 Tax=Halosquirtibacter xylanolyticus TaxID=3374599 RepID=UPI0037495A39|nr:precorrin-6y C5,15-methyltransferase (decarboxylating) subunit CbiE [Prolixibacteraceae bacterium]